MISYSRAEVVKISAKSKPIASDQFSFLTKFILKNKVNIETYLIQSSYKWFFTIAPCLLRNVRHNIIECFVLTGAVQFTPHQFIQKLLNNLPRQQGQRILEHARYNPSQIIHNVGVGVNLSRVGWCSLKFEKIIIIILYRP
jgi:hypothetical protein